MLEWIDSVFIWSGRIGLVLFMCFILVGLVVLIFLYLKNTIRFYILHEKARKFHKPITGKNWHWEKIKWVFFTMALDLTFLGKDGLNSEWWFINNKESFVRGKSIVPPPKIEDCYFDQSKGLRIR